MSRYEQEAWTSSTVGAGAWLNINQAINRNFTDIVRIKVSPNTAGSTSQFQIYKRDTFLAADKLLSVGSFSGDWHFPVERDGTNPETALLEGHPVPYEDLDLSGELHVRIFNNDAVGKTYDLEVDHRPMPRCYTETKTWDPASLADGAMASTTVTVTGATVLNTTCQASLSTITAAGWIISASVTAVDTVTVTLLNHTGGVVDLGSGTLRVHVWME